MDTLEQMDIVVVVYSTDHLDVGTIHLYHREMNDAELVQRACECVEAERGADAMDGFEVHTIVR